MLSIKTNKISDMCANVAGYPWIKKYQFYIDSLSTDMFIEWIITLPPDNSVNKIKYPFHKNQNKFIIIILYISM